MMLSMFFAVSLPPLFEHGIKTLFAWATGQARAPPVGA